MSKGKGNSALAPGTLVGERYLVERELSSGGMGAVYLAEDKKLRRSVALKAMKPSLFDDEDEREGYLLRFHQEALLAANLRHPAIVAIFDFGQEGEDFLWYAMEHIPGSQSLGERLREVLDAGQMLPVDEVLAYFLDAAAGLRAIHNGNVVHRDIKLANLLTYRTAEGPHLKVLDFGVAHLPANQLTVTGQMLGTPHYLPPEYLREITGGQKRPIGPRLDLFGLGVTLYRALTGVMPFRGSGWAEVCRAVLHDHPAKPSELRPELVPGWDRITMRLIEKNPEARYANAGEVYDDLKRVDELPGYDPVEAQEESGPRGMALGLPDLADVPDLDALPAPEAIEQPSERVPPPLTGKAAAFAQLPHGAADRSLHGRLRSLPRSVRLGLVGAALVCLLSLLLVIWGGHADVPKRGPVLEQAALVERPHAVTPSDLLQDENRERQRQLLAPPRGPEPQVKVAADKPVAEVAVRRVRPHAVEAQKAPEPAALEPRRKKIDEVVSFAPDSSDAKAKGDAKLGIPTGTTVAARLLSSVSSDAPNTQVAASLEKALVFADAGTVLSKGTKFLGRATFRVLAGDRGRVEIHFNRMVLLDRSERVISAIAVSATGEAGLPARVSRHNERTQANMAEAALDAAESVLSGAPGGKAGKRFTDDERQDARRLRQDAVTLSLPLNYELHLQFTQPL